MRLQKLAAIVALIAIGMLAAASPAVPAAFTINSGSSSLVLGGTFAGVPVLQQTPGSLVTSYSGTINTDLTATTIQFTSAGADAALQPQNQQPEPGGLPGSDPADYGIQVNTGITTVNGAIRDFLLNLTSGALTLTGGTAFQTSGVTVSISDGALDYNGGGALFGGIDMSGESSGNGTGAGLLQTVGITQTLTLPINVDFTFSVIATDDSELNLLGTLVATRIIPEPASLGALVAGALFLQRRRTGR
jgi:hypothetical protein